MPILYLRLPDGKAPFESMRWTWRVRRGRRSTPAIVGSTSLLVAILSGLVFASVSTGTSIRERGAVEAVSPAAVTRGVVQALDEREWSRVCGLLLPGTRQFISRPQSCPKRFKERFRATYERFTFRRNHWSSGRIISMGPTLMGSSGAQVQFRLEDRYVCEEIPERKPCTRRIHRYVREERMYLAKDVRGRWRIAKFGGILGDMQLSGPQFAEISLFPPATPASLRRSAELPQPPFACEGMLIVEMPDVSGDVIDINYNRVLGTPWMDALSLKLVKMSPEAICVAIRLAETPHPDSEYYLFWHRPEGVHGGRWPIPNGQTVADRGSVPGLAEANVEIAIDGEGIAHATINNVGALTQPSLTSYLPRFGFSDGWLEVELSARQGFPMNQEWALKSVIIAEPSWVDSLLRRRLQGEDRVPNNECVVYPSGKILQEFLCNAPV